MRISAYDSILSTLDTGEVCRGDQDGFELIGALWCALWGNVVDITNRSEKIGQRWESQDYYNEVLSDIYWRSMEPGYIDDDERLGLDIDLLKESMNDLCPAGYYFGGHPDDAWRLGVWPSCWIEEAE